MYTVYKTDNLGDDQHSINHFFTIDRCEEHHSKNH